MGATKIRLSKQEMELVNNAGIILTKNRILQKVKQFFEALHPVYESHTQEALEPASKYLQRHLKISKGENYKGLPYLVLDYPRLFLNNDIGAIRTMFWWGHYFSITLHVSGISKQAVSEAVHIHHKELGRKGFCVAVKNDEWEHDWEMGQYQEVAAVNEMEFYNILHQRHFIKLAKKYPLDNWEQLAAELAADHKWLLHLLSLRHQGDGKDL